jgi:hypothetical protein
MGYSWGSLYATMAGLHVPTMSAGCHTRSHTCQTKPAEHDICTAWPLPQNATVLPLVLLLHCCLTPPRHSAYACSLLSRFARVGAGILKLNNSPFSCHMSLSPSVHTHLSHSQPWWSCHCRSQTRQGSKRRCRMGSWSMKQMTPGKGLRVGRQQNKASGGEGRVLYLMIVTCTTHCLGEYGSQATQFLPPIWHPSTQQPAKYARFCRSVRQKETCTNMRTFGGHES